MSWWKTGLAGLLMLAGGMASAQGLRFSVEQAGERVSAVILENGLLKVRISERGGRIDSLQVPALQLEYCDDAQQTFSGLGKIRDILFNNIETVTGRHVLTVDESTAGQLTVNAVYHAQTGNLAGMEVRRQYVMTADSALLTGRVLVKCHQQPANFQINLHNLFPVKPYSGKVFCYLPTRRGLATFDHAAAKLQKMSLALDPSAPWSAFADRSTGVGLALLLENLEQLDGMYVWGQNDAFTLEANYKDVQLRPMAAADEWETAFRLLPLQGMQFLRQVGPNGAFGAERQQDRVKVTFMAAGPCQGTLSIWQGQQKLAETAADLTRAGQTVTLAWAIPENQAPCDIRFNAQNFDVAMTLPLDFDRQEPVALEKKMPTREVTGVSGFYYYFPDVWLSDETAAELSFGLRGDFKKNDDFRFVLDLPAGVEMTYSRAEVLQESPVVIDGVTYARQEIFSHRRVDYFSAMRVNLRLGAGFEDGSKLYVRAQWRGGEQTPQVLTVRRAPSLPDIGAGLKHFKIGVESDAGKEAWPEYRRIGINTVMVSNWGPPLILYDYKGKDFFAERVSQIKAEGLFPIFGAGAPYCNIDRVMKELNPYYTGAGTLYHPEETRPGLDLSRARARDIHGQQLHMPCPSYHGQLLAKAVDSLKSLIDYGFDHVCYDEEMWGSGNTLCFCEHCKAAFAEFLREKYPQVPYVDPAEATLKPQDFPAVYDAWWDFKTGLVAEIYRTLRQTMATYGVRPGVQRQLWVWVDSSVGEGRYGAITSRLTDYAKLGQYADLLLPMIYTPMAGDVGRVVAAGAGKLTGVPGKIGAGLSPNRTYEYYRVASNNLAPMDAIRQQLLENFFNGGQAAVIWAYRSALRGAYDYHKIAQAVYMLQPVEEILLRGQPVDDVLSSNPEVKVTAWRHGNALAVLVRNYDADSVKAKVTFPGTYSRAMDTLTRAETALGGGLDVNLSDNRVQVFLVQ
jgi:hypothetical protein